MRHQLFGSLLGVLSALVIGLAMYPLRSHLSIATAALILVIPVVVGVTTGGLTGGLLSTVAGFLVYDFGFIPPTGTFTVGTPQSWVALFVYAIVMALVARLVSHLHSAQESAQSRARSVQHLLDVSELLLADDPALGTNVVHAIRDAFDIEGVALVQNVGDHLAVVATAGEPLAPDELARFQPGSQIPVPLTTGGSIQALQTLALSSSEGPVGILVLRNAPNTRAIREALPILANHLAVSLERGALRERVHRAELLEEIDRLRHTLVGAVSHDLRTPLASMKVASSTLLASGDTLSSGDRRELHELVDQQTDRLTRLVNNLLDMTRIQSGAFTLRTEPTPVRDLIDDALGGLRSALADREVTVHVAPEVPLVDADPLLIVQVLANLVDNANRHGPAATPITIEVRLVDDKVLVSVSDAGSGVPIAEREAIFETFVRFDTGGRSGLGLSIAKAFLDAHGEKIWVRDATSGGASFNFTLSPARADYDELV